MKCDPKKLTPLADKIVVERIKAPDKVGNILLPDQAKQRSQFGKVLAVGPGRLNEHTSNHHPMHVKKGQIVLFGRYGGNEVPDFEDEVLVLREDEILAVVGE